MRLRALPAAGVALAAVAVAAGCGTGGIARHGDVSHGKQLFVQKCGACHTLADAGTLGTVGPNLDDALGLPRAQGYKESTLEQVVVDQIRIAIMPMPSNLVRGQDAVDVAAYVASVAGASSASGGGTTPSAPASSAGSTSPGASTAPRGGAAAPSGGASKGKELYASLGCQACHSLTGSAGAGPTFKGLAGSQVQLANGQTVKADDAYLLDSIENPDKQIVKGYQPGIMSGTIKPGSVSKADAQALVDFIKAQK